jgi:hypothetical protein
LEEGVEVGRNGFTVIVCDMVSDHEEELERWRKQIDHR